MMNRAHHVRNISYTYSAMNGTNSMKKRMNVLGVYTVLIECNLFERKTMHFNNRMNMCYTQALIKS